MAKYDPKKFNPQDLVNELASGRWVRKPGKLGNSTYGWCCLGVVNEVCELGNESDYAYLSVDSYNADTEKWEVFEGMDWLLGDPLDSDHETGYLNPVLRDEEVQETLSKANDLCETTADAWSHPDDAPSGVLATLKKMFPEVVIPSKEEMEANRVRTELESSESKKA